MENWNDGMLEYWETNCITNHSVIPLFHHSSIPINLLCGLCVLSGSIVLQIRRGERLLALRPWLTGRRRNWHGIPYPSWLLPPFTGNMAHS
ncbi:MAG TPA: hypothetical protein VF372_04145, partial [Thermodesulfobacteriota bacterium]